MLSWFHKYQKIMLGFFGVGLMFVFTVSLGSGVDPIMDRLSGRTTGGPSKEVAVTWDGGQLDTQDLDRLRVQRNLLGRFMGRVGQLARERGGRQRVSMLPLYTGDRSILELEVLAREATKMGIEVNDETVIDYLNQLTDGTILPSEYSTILKETTGSNLPENALFPMLARELKAQKVRGLIQSGSFPASPIAAWDYYNRLNRLVTAEIMPIAVDDFISQVDEPAETEVAEMFEKHKRFYPTALSPEPGFRVREKRAFQYVKVNYDAILEKEKAGITDQEIQAYYDENKEQYVIQKDGALDLSGLPDEESTPAAESNNGAESTNGAEPNNGAESTGTESTNDGASATADADATDAAEGNESETDSADEATTTSGNPSTDSDTEKPAPTPTAIPQEDKASEAADEPVSETVAEDAESEEKGTNPLRTAEEDPPTEDPASEASTDEPSATAGDSKESDSESTETEEPAETPEAETPEAETPEDETPEDDADAAPADVRTDDVIDKSDLDDISSYKELSEVADDIRQSLAAPKAQIKMKKVLDTISRDMERYFQDRTLWEMDVEDQPDAPEPPMPDFAGIVDGTQAIKGEIGLTDRVAIEEHELGQAFDIAIYSRENIQRVTFADSAYLPSTVAYRPSVFPKLDMATDRYVYWMTDKTDEYIPQLDEVRTQVVEACKRQQALEVAKQEAATLAATAEKANTSLQESTSSEKYTQFIDTGEISWVTAPLQEGATPSITPITGAEDAGPEMREALYNLAPGGIGYAANMPKDKVYLFRVSKETPNVEIRREQFLKNGVGAPVLFLARRDSMIGLSEWYRDLSDDIEVDWQRDPKTGENGDF